MLLVLCISWLDASMCCLFVCPFIVEFVVVVKLNMYVFQAMLHSRTSDALRGSVVECHFLDFR